MFTQIFQELLALGDEMGTVSTALSEEALSRSLKKSIYQETDETGAISLNKDDDIKCSICQVSLFIQLQINPLLCLVYTSLSFFCILHTKSWISFFMNHD